ncbi:MAG: class I SAM-dependent methyltransferase [Gammaproteobacteria bacterium]|nr:class I SAM-dependent methyltransferase [Gammaproteobacteria bacterium]MBQ0839743.1 class I SAM-dependent methyltransferase [Gammaproteobacteria bacterium]
MNPDAYLEMADTEARHWWFTGRRAILAHLIDTFDLPPNARILEIGSGTGGNLQMLSTFGQVSALEMDATAREIAMNKTGRCFDIRPGFCPTDIPFVGEKFDLICLFDVLEHIDEDVETLIAVKALLAEGGRVLVTVPAYRWLWSAHDVFLHHKRRYSKAEFNQKIFTSGLHPVKISHFNTILFPLAAIVRMKDKLFGNSLASGSSIPPAPINRLFTAIFRGERLLLSKINLPFGVSLLGVLRAGHF